MYFSTQLLPAYHINWKVCILVDGCIPIEDIAGCPLSIHLSISPSSSSTSHGLQETLPHSRGWCRTERYPTQNHNMSGILQVG